MRVLLQDFIQDAREENVRIWHSPQAVGSDVAYLNAANNVILRAKMAEKLGRDKASTYGISLIIAPMVAAAEPKEKNDPFSGVKDSV